MYNYLTERSLLARRLGAPTQIRPIDRLWGASVIQSQLADAHLTIQVTDQQYLDPTSGQLVQVCCGWPPAKRQHFGDLAWCVDVYLDSGYQVCRHRGVDSRVSSLISTLTNALQYALAELEPKLCTTIT